MTGERSTVHPDAVWLDRADAVVVATVPDGAADGDGGGAGTERLPARRVGMRRFEVCCVPFLVGLALGDVVETDDAGRVTGVIASSGRSVVRVRFDASAAGARADVARDLAYLGGVLEWASPQLLAVDVHDPLRARAIEEYLAGRELRGDLVFARVRTRPG